MHASKTNLTPPVLHMWTCLTAFAVWKSDISEVGDRDRVQFPVRDIYLGM